MNLSGYLYLIPPGISSLLPFVYSVYVPFGANLTQWRYYQINVDDTQIYSALSPGDDSLKDSLYLCMDHKNNWMKPNKISREIFVEQRRVLKLAYD